MKTSAEEPLSARVCDRSFYWNVFLGRHLSIYLNILSKQTLKPILPCCSCSSGTKSMLQFCFGVKYWSRWIDHWRGSKSFQALLVVHGLCLWNNDLSYYFRSISNILEMYLTAHELLMWFILKAKAIFGCTDSFFYTTLSFVSFT